MYPLNLYFNELSSPPNNIEPQELRNWSNWASSLIAGLKKVSQSQSEYTLVFPDGQFHAIYANKPLSVWLREWVGIDQYRWLLGKIRNVRQLDDELRQVYFQDQPTTGLTLAHISEAWAFSFPKVGSPWLSPTIIAIEYRHDGSNIFDAECVIMHIANEQHSLHWQQKLCDRGREVATNNKISIIAEYPIVMYPLDHGYPHIHLVDPHQFKTLAKFRIDRFERMSGPPRWDNEVGSWVEQNARELLRSWERCQLGEHPYQITY